MSAKNVEHKFIVPNSVEVRDYQVNLASQAKNENCLIILPTGLGKTVVALHVIADYLTKGNGGVLFLAPTKVLVNQHYEFLKNTLTIDDIARKIVDTTQFNLVIFDEAHRAVGDYAYVEIAKQLSGLNVRLLGMTATLPS